MQIVFWLLCVLLPCCIMFFIIASHHSGFSLVCEIPISRSRGANSWWQKSTPFLRHFLNCLHPRMLCFYFHFVSFILFFFVLNIILFHFVFYFICVYIFTCFIYAYVIKMQFCCIMCTTLSPSISCHAVLLFSTAKSTVNSDRFPPYPLLSWQLYWLLHALFNRQDPPRNPTQMKRKKYNK